mgnify:CR=1 FL=1
MGTADMDRRRGRLPVKRKEADIMDSTYSGIFKKFEEFTREILNLFDDLMDEIPGMGENRDIRISQTDEDVVIEAEIPGLSVDDLDVNITDDYVRLSGKQQVSNEYRSLDDNSYRSQSYFKAFFRTIRLPERVKYRQARVEYKGDNLHISIPKI